MYGIIYLIRNKINNKMYVGQTIYSFDIRYNGNLRKNTHNKDLKEDIEKYGIDNFEITKEFDKADSKEELDSLEQLYIKTYNLLDDKYGYNKTLNFLNAKRRNYNNIKSIINLYDKNIFLSMVNATKYYKVNESLISVIFTGRYFEENRYNKYILVLLDEFKKSLDEHYRFNTNLDDIFKNIYIDLEREGIEKVNLSDYI